MKYEHSKPLKHGQFNLEQLFSVSPQTVFEAWTDIERKQNWFVGPETRKSIRRTSPSLEPFHSLALLIDWP